MAMLPLALDSLLHIAGIARLDRVSSLSVGDARDQLNVNLLSPMVLTNALLPALRARRGHVVFANSSAGIHAKPGWAAYSSSKFGLRGFADSLRAEEKGSGIRVSSLYLGRTATPMQRQVHAQEGWDYDPSRWMQPETVADSVAAAPEPAAGRRRAGAVDPASGTGHGGRVRRGCRLARAGSP